MNKYSLVSMSACRYSVITQICSATMGFTVEDRYLVKSCERANVMQLHACVRCFLNKNGTLIKLKTLTEETDNTSTIK